jgi:hypothetical protein
VATSGERRQRDALLRPGLRDAAEHARDADEQREHARRGAAR